jgi:hypothetical protein
MFYARAHRENRDWASRRASRCSANATPSGGKPGILYGHNILVRRHGAMPAIALVITMLA